MRTIYLCSVAAVAILFQSCLEPEPLSEDETLTIDSNTSVTVSEANDSEQSIVVIDGLWTSISVESWGTITTTDNTSSNPPEVINLNGIGNNINHTINFQNAPNTVEGEGIYSMTIEYSGDQSIPEQEIQGLSLITSQTQWNYEGDLLTLNSGLKIRVANVTELTEDTLELYLEEIVETTSQDGAITKTTAINTNFQFVR